MNPIDQKALRYSTELSPGPPLLREFYRWINRVEDLNDFINLSIKEGVAGLLYKNLVKSDLLGIIDSSQQKKLSSRYYLTVRDNLKRIYDLKQLLPQFAQQQAQVVLLKGIILIRRVLLWLKPQN